ncbi:MAG: hypothetical protein B6I31_05020 [Desulfobacteraceae bacterium 4572_19]|nr:MAG: hypothetical protein B6I31_05020 [Desulfobacteraceae bacterium 4572_19]
MKIYSPDIIKQNIIKPEVPLPKNQSYKPNGIFQGLLDHATDKINLTEETDSTKRLYEPAPINLHHIIENSNQTIPEKINDTFDLLENYIKDIGNPSKTLKEIEPQLNSILNMALSADSEYQQDSNSDDELGDIINQLLTTIRLEQFKMQRGDYIDNA